jgi:hypothetical protein
MAFLNPALHFAINVRQNVAVIRWTTARHAPPLAKLAQPFADSNNPMLTASPCLRDERERERVASEIGGDSMD